MSVYDKILQEDDLDTVVNERLLASARRITGRAPHLYMDANITDGMLFVTAARELVARYRQDAAIMQDQNVIAAGIAAALQDNVAGSDEELEQAVLQFVMQKVAQEPLPQPRTKDARRPKL